ncbi:MAG TPA: hypothetical protein DIT94_06880 [Deltaproteobacteria bacterium]|nr:hypothetical protein [Deltaproteobacteria bacterium]
MVVPKLLTRTSVFRSGLMLSRSEKSFMACLMKCLSARIEICPACYCSDIREIILTDAFKKM